MKQYADFLSQASLAIYLFHGVIDEQTYRVRNYTNKHILCSDFTALISELKKRGHGLSMDEVLGHLTDNIPFPDNAYAITFDDGFENNASIAAKVLEEFHTPATFYVTTDFVDAQRMSWIDVIELCFERCESAHLVFPWGKRSFETVDEKISLLKEIREKAKWDATLDQYAFAFDLCRQAGFENIPETDPALDLKLDWDQVRALDNHALFTVGGHTHTHLVLSQIDSDTLEYELDTSLGLLRDKGGVLTKHYSYPEGLSHCYNETVIASLKDRGITCCPTAIEGINTHLDSPFHLKRIMVE